MRRVVALALGVAVLPACTVGVRRGAPTPSPTPAASVSLPACRTSYRPPDPKRPAIRLAFALDDRHEKVTGTEHVEFTPDLPVMDVVLRLWPNGPELQRGRIDVTRASLPMRLEARGGSAARPTLLRLALPHRVAAGTRVTVDVSFVLSLPPAGIDRWGHTERTAWWASGHPLLAWVRGHGWATEDAVELLGETATSEAADYDVTVTAPAGDTVLANGVGDGPAGDTWHFRNDRARDVAVAVGPFTTRQHEVGGVPVTVAVSDELATGADAEAVFANIDGPLGDAMPLYQRELGPYGFDTLTVVAIGDIAQAGIEYPGLFYVGSRRYDVVVPHELAHEWFYGLVGDDQARDPWLDEAFATYGESLVDPDNQGRYLDAFETKLAAVGLPMTYWAAHKDEYSPVVYAKGAGALLAARETNRAAWTALLRCYVAEHAYTVATPDDLRAALAPLPAAVAVLRSAGAL